MTDYTYEDVRQAVNRELKRRFRQHAIEDPLDSLFANDILTAIRRIHAHSITDGDGIGLTPEADILLIRRALDQFEREQKIGDEPV